MHSRFVPKGRFIKAHGATVGAFTKNLRVPTGRFMERHAAVSSIDMTIDIVVESSESTRSLMRRPVGTQKI